MLSLPPDMIWSARCIAQYLYECHRDVIDDDDY